MLCRSPFSLFVHPLSNRIFDGVLPLKGSLQSFAIYPCNVLCMSVTSIMAAVTVRGQLPHFISRRRLLPWLESLVKPRRRRVPPPPLTQMPSLHEYISFSLSLGSQLILKAPSPHLEQINQPAYSK